MKFRASVRYLLDFPARRRLWRLQHYLTEFRHGEICMAAIELYALEWAIRKLNSPPNTVVEIGSYCGGSTVVIASAARRRNRAVRVYAIDPFEFHEERYQWDYEDAFDQNVNEAGLSANVVKLKTSSTQAALEWNKMIDFLFIDGDHSYDAVAADIRNFVPHVRVGGIIAFHDYKPHGKDGVRHAINELIMPYHKLVQRGGSIVCFRRMDKATQGLWYD